MRKIIIKNETSDLTDVFALAKIYQLLIDYSKELEDFDQNIITFTDYVCIFTRRKSGTLNFTFRDREHTYNL